MSTPTTILDRLLEEAPNTTCREHVLEQASYAVDNVQQRFLGKFDTLISEISNDWGQPEFNASTSATDEGKSPIPSWVTGSRQGESAQKVLRLSYWKRTNGISYVLLRLELDSKDRPNYYDLVLGARRKNKAESVRVDKLRNTDTSFVGWLKRLVGIK